MLNWAWNHESTDLSVQKSIPWEGFRQPPKDPNQLRFVRVCDRSSQVAGQQQFSFPPASMADGVSLDSNRHDLRDLSEPASICFAPATALDAPTVSISDRLALLCSWLRSRVLAPDLQSKALTAARHIWSSLISRLGQAPVDQYKLAVPFSRCCAASPHPGAVVESLSDIVPCFGELQKFDERPPVRHMHSTECSRQRTGVSIDGSHGSRSCSSQELPRCRRKVVHEEGNADQCPPTGGKPDRHC